jgi:hypothetical protein
MGRQKMLSFGNDGVSNRLRILFPETPELVSPGTHELVRKENFPKLLTWIASTAPGMSS